MTVGRPRGARNSLARGSSASTAQDLVASAQLLQPADQPNVRDVQVQLPWRVLPGPVRLRRINWRRRRGGSADTRSSTGLQPPVGSTHRATVTLGHPMGCEVWAAAVQALDEREATLRRGPDSVKPGDQEEGLVEAEGGVGLGGAVVPEGGNQRVRLHEAFTGQAAVVSREETGLGLQAPGGLEEEVLRVLRSSDRGRVSLTVDGSQDVSRREAGEVGDRTRSSAQDHALARRLQRAKAVRRRAAHASPP